MDNRLEVGQIVQQPIERDPIFISPQIRQVAPGETVDINITKLKNEEILEVTNWSFTHFSQNSEQDVIVRLLRKSEQIIRSGFQSTQDDTNFSVVSPRPETGLNTRINSNSGAPYNTLSSTNGEGFHDNYFECPFHFPFEIRGAAMVLFRIENQSSVHSYSLEVFLSGAKLRVNERGASWATRPVI
jgi:hypothetical protein